MDFTQGYGEKRPGPPPQTGPSRKKFKKNHLQYSADIVFMKGSVLQTVPSLSKLLKGVTGVIGLQFVWEYRSPSKTVQPHYICKLCSLYCVQHDITDHVKGWKHCFKYMKKYHPEKITFEEEEVVKDPSLKGPLRVAAAEVEKIEGRGQIRVILREPIDVPNFQKFRSAIPKLGPPPSHQEIGQMGPPFGTVYHDSGYAGDFSHHGAPYSDYEAYKEPGFDSYMSRDSFSGPGMDRGSFSDDMGQIPPGGGNGFGPGGGSSFGPGGGSSFGPGGGSSFGPGGGSSFGPGGGNSFGPGGGSAGYGRSGQQDEGPNKMYTNEYQDNQMRESFNDGPPEREGVGAPAGSSSLPNTLLTYLDTFQIESEADAQLVLKVTQKLTDVLMEYRLRSISGGSNANNSSMSSDDRYSSNVSGPSRYPDGPSRYYN